MIIELKHEDADFILKFLKADLVRVRKNLANIEQDYNKFYAYLSKKPEKGREDEVVSNIMSNVKDVVCEHSKELCSDLEKCIELLTIGSEK